MCWLARQPQNRDMETNALTTLSENMAQAVEAIAPAVVQVHGRRRPVSGVVYASDIVLTSARALGGEDGVSVTAPDGRTAAAELAGWDPASGLAVLRVPDSASRRRNCRSHRRGSAHRARGRPFVE